MSATRYWGVNAIASILQAATTRITGELYIPTRNARTEELARLAKDHAIAIRYCKHPSEGRASSAAIRYPLLITATPIVPPRRFRTVAHYLSLAQGDFELVLLLDGITDVGNLASIARSAYNFGVTCLVASPQTGGGLGKNSRRDDAPLLAHRSAGYYLRLNVVERENLAQAIDTLKRNQFWIYGAASEGAPANTLALDAPKRALVVGDEHSGLRTLTRRSCDLMAALPHRAQCESLNVAVATGILLYELDRQRPAPASASAPIPTHP